MSDPFKPLPPAEKKPGEGLPDIPDTEETEVDLPDDGQIPGLPLSRDPLLNPGPVPPEREKPPLD